MPAYTITSFKDIGKYRNNGGKIAYKNNHNNNEFVGNDKIEVFRLCRNQ